jgi:hypothetical protein
VSAYNAINPLELIMTIVPMTLPDMSRKHHVLCFIKYRSHYGRYQNPYEENETNICFCNILYIA